MLVERAAGKEFQLHHITCQVKAGTTLVCVPATGKRLPVQLKESSFRRGVYCTLEYWSVVEPSQPRRMCMVYKKGYFTLLNHDELVHFYSADRYRLWVERTHRALVKECHEELSRLRGFGLHR